MFIYTVCVLAEKYFFLFLDTLHLSNNLNRIMENSFASHKGLVHSLHYVKYDNVFCRKKMLTNTRLMLLLKWLKV